MQSALRPYVTAGVALVGASAIAVSPVTAPPAAVQEVRDAAVQLSALDNPLEVFGQVLQQTFESARLVGQGIAENPAPVLEQLIRNQIANVAGLPAAIQSQIEAFPQLRELALESISNELDNIGTLSGLGPAFVKNIIGAVLGTGPGTVEDQIQIAIDAVQNAGDFGTAFGALALIPVAVLGGGNGLPNLFTLLPELSVALQQPFTDLARVLPIAAGPLLNAGNVAAALPTAALGLGVGPLLGLATLPTTLGNTLNGLIESVQTNDPEVAFNAIVEQSSAALGILLNTVIGQGGVVDGLQNFREAIATALGAPAVFSSFSSVEAPPQTSAKSFTLTAPVEKALPAPKSGTSSVGETSGTDGDTDIKDTSATATDTKDNTKSGNLFTPGSSTKGKHRAENGPSIGKELRDAVKSITGLGRSGKSDKETASASASTNGSGSNNTGSSDSGSGGGSGSK